MCGISGIFNFANSEVIDHSVLKAMATSLQHRGPDEEGFYINQSEHVGLAHRRLSIIDLAAGQQPMANEREDIWIVFNGEIYNFPELREDLEQKGYHFKTRSDTEVIIHLYEDLGCAAFQHLNGIFAVGIFDQRKKTVILARDHFGVKPLYYRVKDGRLIFASEIKAILQDPHVSREFDYEAFDTFLTLRYNPSPQTLFKGIQKLTPGHYLTISARDDANEIPFTQGNAPINERISEQEAVEEHRRLLSQAVKRQMISDVPVGLLLSGGVDSAVLGFLMRQYASHKIKTFTIGFEGVGDYNELADAQISAQHIGSDHYDMTISARDYLQFFCESFKTTEEPIAETTIPALYFVSKLAATKLKVVLAGQGADEPLAGYSRYLGAHFLTKYSRFFQSLPMSTIARILPRNERFKRAAYVSRFSDEFSKTWAIYSIFTPEQKKMLLRKPIAAAQNKTPKRLKELYAESENMGDMLNKILYMDTRMSLSDNLLLFNDKATMRNSLEMRVPFLDLELVRFIETLPSSFKLRGKETKFIHKKAVEAWLPKKIIYRKKRGFQTPVDEWLQHDLGTKIKKFLTAPGSACFQFFNPSYIEQLVKLHQQRRENYQRHIFLLLSFELWYQSFFKEQQVESKLLTGVRL